MSFDYSNLPARLKDRPGFIGFNRFPVENGKTKKLPVSLITGKAINAHDSKHHHSFKEALRLYMAGAPCDGLGFVICKGDNLTFIDFDHIRASVEQQARARRLGVSLNTWGEVSQSGEGAHFIVGGTLPKSFNKSETLGVEGYSSGRFIALTGKKIKGTPDDIADNQAALDALYVECCGPILPSATGKKMLQSSTQANTQEPETPEAVARIRSALALFLPKATVSG